MFLYICLHDTKGTFRSRSSHSCFQSEWNSRSDMTEVSFWYHCKLKTNFLPDWKSQTVIKLCSLARCSILLCECSTNFTLERNSFQNESHISKQPLIWINCSTNWIENTFESGWVWEHLLCVLVWTNSILKTHFFVNVFLSGCLHVLKLFRYQFLS